MAKQIKVKYFNKELKPLTKISKGDWIDMRAEESNLEGADGCEGGACPIR